MDRPVVGIDLGTTNSVIAHIRNGAPVVVPGPDGSLLLPSVVLLDTQNRLVVGQDARSALVAMPDRTVASVKRHMGDDVAIRLGDRTFTPEEISAFILREVRSRLDSVYGDETVEAVITVPAYFNEAQRRATKTAGELAGFVVERIINEPTAAALAFGFFHRDVSRRLVVYDLGGGTFDVSVLRLTDGILEVLASTGNRHLGGEDFDWQLVDWMATTFMKKHGPDPRKDLRARALLKDAAEQAKIDLSDESTTEVSLPVLMSHDGAPLGFRTTLRRAGFETLIRPYLDETLAKVDEVLEAAGVKVDDVDDVLLVGGSTRIPLVRRLVEERFGRPALTAVDPDLAVALGAAVQGGLKSGQLDDAGMVVTDVAPFSMGIAVAQADWLGNLVPGHFHVLIPKNTTVPVTRKDRFTTISDGQTSLRVEIFQGEHAMVAHNFALGSFLLEGIPPGPVGSEAIEVTFRYNLNGMLEVTARSETNGQKMGVVVQDALQRESQSALEESRRRVEQWLDRASEEQEDEVPEEALGPSEEDGWDPPGDDWDDADSQAQDIVARLAGLSARGQLVDKVERARGELHEARATHDLNRLLAAIDAGLDVLLDADL